MLIYENADFFRASEEGIQRIPSPTAPKRIKHTILLVPLKSLAISTFSFPFSNMLRVREALKLQTLPYAAAGEMELFPSVLEKSARSSSGIAWYVPSGDLDTLEAPMPQIENRVWPAPLPLVSKIEGDGVTLWKDEANICSILWRSGKPVLYRWKPASKTTPEAERSWFEAYCESREEPLGGFFAMDATKLSELVLLPEILKESLRQYAWTGDVNLSRGALDSALGLERFVRSGTRVALWLLMLGLLVLGGNGLRYYDGRQSIEAVHEQATRLYRETFEPTRTGRIANPLNEAIRKIRELRPGETEGRPINEVLSELGSIFEDNSSMDVTLDTVRYNLEGVDYTGSAPDMNTIQNFQRAWAGKARSAQIGNLQNAPGIGFRFDLSVRW